MDLKRELTDYEIGGIGDIKKHTLRFHSYRIGTMDAPTLSFTKFPHKTKACGNLTSLAHNCGLLRFDLDFDETFKYSLLIRQNSLESAKCFCYN